MLGNLRPGVRLVAIVAAVAFFLPVPEAGGSEAVKIWSVEDFDGVIAVGLEGYRDFENGRRGFARGTCVKCHRLAGDGPEAGVDLARSGERYDPRSLLAKMLSTEHPADRAGASRRYGVEAAKGGYLDDFEEEDVLDLLAYLVAGGDAKDPVFAR